MSKIHLPNQTSWYYLAIGVGAVTALVSLGFLIRTAAMVGKIKVEPDLAGITPQEQTLSKVLDLIQNKVVSYPAPGVSSTASPGAVIDNLPQE